MLSPTQPLEDIRRMASILCTGVFGDSIGPQVGNEAHQRRNESDILDVVTRLLIEAPGVGVEEESTRRSKVVQLRKELVHFLGCVVGIRVESDLMVNHPTALSRLVRRIADELDEVYDFRGDVASR